VADPTFDELIIETGCTILQLRRFVRMGALTLSSESRNQLTRESVDILKKRYSLPPRALKTIR